jgi:hypothetical protein
MGAAKIYYRQVCAQANGQRAGPAIETEGARPTQSCCE